MRYLVILFSLFAGLHAHSVSLTGSDCDETGYQKTWRDLIVKVNWFGPLDPRKELSKIADKLAEKGFGPDEIERAKRCSGYIYCPKDEHNPEGYSSSQSVEWNGQLVAVAHQFLLDSSGHSIRTNLNSCYFANYIHPNHRLPLKFSSEEKNALARDIEKEKQSDILKVRLKSPLADCHSPYEVDQSDEPMPVGQEILTVSLPTPDISPRPTGKEPVAHFCQVQDRQNLEAPTIYYTNCSATKGDSGSMQLTPKIVFVNGSRKTKWIIKSIISQGGSP